MGTLLKVGEQDIQSYQNRVQYPVPYASGQMTASYYASNPNPGTSVSYLLDQLDGVTTRTYNQYLEDYARYTVPLLGTGTEVDPYYFYPYPVLVRARVSVTAADFVLSPYLNGFQYLRAYAGVKYRLNAFWYNASNTNIYQQRGGVFTLEDSNWRSIAGNYPAPPQSILNQVAYVYLGVEIDGTTMSATQNWFDITGSRATPIRVNNFDDFRGLYWDGSTVFTQPTHVSSWAGTPRASFSNLTITELSTITEETEFVQSFSVSEDVTGIDASSLSGGTSQANIAVPYDPSKDDYLGLGAEIQDYDLGNFYGRVRNLNQITATEDVDVQVDESLSLLNAWVTAPPMSGTLSTVLRNYAALAEAPIRGFEFEGGVGAIAVNVPGFVGNLYDKIREFMAAYNVELVTIDGAHVARPTMQESLILENFTETPNVGKNLQETSRYVRVHWYDNEYMTNTEVYPLAKNPQETDEDFPEPTIYSVGAGETVTVDIQLRASLLSVNNPTYVAFVPDAVATGNGIYTAVGSDNLPITPAQWAGGGGALNVVISPDDPSVLKVTITGPDFANLAPFRIAMSSGSGNYYNALHITGTGVFVRDQYMDLATGGLPSATGQLYAVECTNPYISTRQQAYQAGHIIAGRQAQVQTIQFSVPTPARQPGSPDTVVGLLPGKKFVHADQQFRIETVDINHATVSGTGVYALTAGDFDHFFTRAGGMTAGQFDDLYDDVPITALNFSLRPLKHRFAEV